jgi:uncharacterized membrane protein
MLQVPQSVPRRTAIGQLLLNLCALVGAGLFAVVLVPSSTPYVDQHIVWVDFFHTALVVRVDLSVLVGLLAFAGVFSNLHAARRGQRWGWVASGLAVIGTLMMARAPLFCVAEALMSSYLPVLQDPLFLGGLVVFALGVGVQLSLSLCCVRPIDGTSNGGALPLGIDTGVVVAAAPSESAPQRAALIGSAIFFGVAGIRGFLVHGNSVTVRCAVTDHFWSAPTSTATSRSAQSGVG